MRYIDQYGNVFTDMRFVRSRYVDNGRPYVEAWCKEEGNDYYEPYADVTVNVFAPLTAIDGYHVHADTNNVPRLVGWMCEQGFMTKTGKVARSGWCGMTDFIAERAVDGTRDWYAEVRGQHGQNETVDIQGLRMRAFRDGYLINV